MKKLAFTILGVLALASNSYGQAWNTLYAEETTNDKTGVLLVQVGGVQKYIELGTMFGNYVFNTAQSPGAPEDNYVLTYDNAAGTISLEPVSGSGLTNWGETTTTLRPNVDGYDLGSSSNLIGDIWSQGTMTIRETDDGGDAVKFVAGSSSGNIEAYADNAVVHRFPGKNYPYTNNTYPWVFGATAPPASNDPYVVLAGTVDDTVGDANSYKSGTGVNSHGIMDLRILTRTGDIGINSFDARLDVNGTAPYNHIAGFQFFPNIGTTGQIDRLTAFQSLPDFPATATIDWMRHYEARDIDLQGGGGTVTNQAGLFVEAMSAATNNYWILGGGTFDGAGTDVDHNIFAIRTTDAQGSWPLLSWDDSDDDFDLNRGLNITGNLSITGDMTMTNLDLDRIDYNEQASVTNPAAGDGTIYLDSDDNSFKAIVADEGNTLQTIRTSGNVLFTEVLSASHTLSIDPATGEGYGSIHYVDAAATITLPATTEHCSFTIITIGAVAVSVDADAADLIVLDGTALDDGDKITNTSTAGDLATITRYNATGWYGATNSWTDGGP